MDPVITNVLYFTLMAYVGMLAHYGKSWATGQIAGSLFNYLFKDNVRGTVLSAGGILGTAFTAWTTNHLAGLTLQQTLEAGFLAGFTIDSTLNGGSPPAGSAPKQAGFASLNLLLVTAAASLLWLVGCATSPVNPNAAARDAAYAAQTAADLAIRALPGLLGTHEVTKATAVKINTAALAVSTAAAAVYTCTAAAASTCSTAAVTAALGELNALVPAGTAGVGP